MKQLKIVIPILICLAAFAITLLYLLTTSRFKPTSVVCPDGTVLELTAVTYGKFHNCPMEHPWNRFLQVIPTLIQQKLGVVTRNKFQSKEDSMVAWFRWKGKTARWFGRKMVIDPSGYRSKINGWSYQGNPPANSGLSEIWLGYEIKVFPHRAKSFTFQFSNWNDQVLAEFEIRNPVRSNPAPFPADPLPQSQTVDDMEFKLISLEVPNTDHASKEVERIFRNGDVRATFEIKQNGQVVENWQPVNIWLEDATGNKSKNSSWSNREEKGKASMTFSPGLFSDEAWKIRAQFARKSDFLSEDLWTATVPLPQHPQYETNLVSHVLHNKKIILKGVADENNILLDGTKGDGVRSQRNNKSKQFRIFVEDMDTDLRLDLVRVKDDQDRECKDSGKSWGGGQYDYDLEIEPDAKSLTVTVALHRSKFANYTAEPQEIKTVAQE